MPTTPTLYTIGHSHHTSENFIALLKQHTIDCLVDVRSQPYSRYNPQFNRETLSAALANSNIQYVYRGSTLGGRPEQSDFYDPGSERPTYARQRQTELYQQGLQQLSQQAQQTRTVIMCSEGNPHDCHRQSLITPDLLDQGFAVYHILPDGQLEMAEKTLEQAGFDF
ncbi:MAG: DUF488 domain-containing protein [Chloroflexi bacterium]|nr:DUF488 domain-containing protein [Chloroflexota bacterium]